MKYTLVALSVMAVAVSAVPVAQEEPIPILHQDTAVYHDGTFRNHWESGNGIKVAEEGTVKAVDKNDVTVVNGEVSYTDDQGNKFHLTYVADENGFQPRGDHLPTVPPLPESVARALEYIATHPYVEKKEKQSSNQQPRRH